MPSAARNRRPREREGTRRCAVTYPRRRRRRPHNKHEWETCIRSRLCRRPVIRAWLVYKRLGATRTIVMPAPHRARNYLQTDAHSCQRNVSVFLTRRVVTLTRRHLEFPNTSASPRASGIRDLCKDVAEVRTTGILLRFRTFSSEMKSNETTIERSTRSRIATCYRKSNT